MTIQEAHLSYKILLDKLDSEAYPDILPEEIDYYLNLGQERFIKQRYGITNSHKESFEVSRKRIDDLKNVVADFNLILDNSYFNKYNGFSDTYQISYSDLQDHWFTLRQMAKFSVKDCKCEPCSWISNIKETQTDDYVVLKNDPFNSPTKEYPLALSRTYIDIDFGEKISFSKYEVIYQNRYLKKPRAVSLPNNITFELSDHTHQEIVELAVNITLETIESQRYQTQKQLLIEQE